MPVRCIVLNLGASVVTINWRSSNRSLSELKKTAALQSQLHVTNAFPLHSRAAQQCGDDGKALCVFESQCPAAAHAVLAAAVPLAPHLHPALRSLGTTHLTLSTVEQRQVAAAIASLCRRIAPVDRQSLRVFSAHYQRHSRAMNIVRALVCPQ